MGWPGADDERRLPALHEPGAVREDPKPATEEREVVQGDAIAPFLFNFLFSLFVYPSIIILVTYYVDFKTITKFQQENTSMQLTCK